MPGKTIKYASLKELTKALEKVPKGIRVRLKAQPSQGIFELTILSKEVYHARSLTGIVYI